MKIIELRPPMWLVAPWLFRRADWRGFACPVPFAALVVFWGEPTEDEYLHEHWHVEQMKVLGKWRWLKRIGGEYVRYGYKNAPLEIEARKAAGQE